MIHIYFDFTGGGVFARRKAFLSVRMFLAAALNYTQLFSEVLLSSKTIFKTVIKVLSFFNHVITKIIYLLQTYAKFYGLF